MLIFHFLTTYVHFPFSCRSSLVRWIAHHIASADKFIVSKMTKQDSKKTSGDDKKVKHQPIRAYHPGVSESSEAVMISDQGLDEMALLVQRVEASKKYTYMSPSALQQHDTLLPAGKYCY